MKSKEAGLSIERLRSLLAYDPGSGELRWKQRTAKRVQIGDVAGCVRNGYRWISIDRKLHAAHRLVWAIAHGQWPQHQLDHKDLDRDNNRLGNLREATALQNRMNARVQPSNVLGVKGVRRKADRPRKRPFEATIWIAGRPKCLGCYATAEEAGTAYFTAAAALYGDFARSD